MKKKLLFRWPMKRAPRVGLPFFILLAALLHLLGNYCFNIIYPSPQRAQVQAAEVFFLPAGSPMSKQLAPWIQANDPALFSPLKIVQAHRPKIPTSIYLPKQPLPLLHPLPSPKEETIESLLPPTNESTLLPSPVSKNQSSTPTLLPTSVQFSESITMYAPLLPSQLDHPNLPDGTQIPLHPTSLTLEIDASGLPLHAIIMQSSGSQAADEAARSWLLTRRFSPAQEEHWGRVLVYWGAKN